MDPDGVAVCLFSVFPQENMLENGGEPKTIDMIDQVSHRRDTIAPTDLPLGSLYLKSADSDENEPASCFIFVSQPPPAQPLARMAGPHCSVWRLDAFLSSRSLVCFLSSSRTST